MGEVNAKNELLELVKKYNLDILSIDCGNADKFAYLHAKDNPLMPKELLELYKENAKSYNTLDSLDFNYDTCMEWELRGIVYCIESDTREPIWLTRGGDEASSWWNINKVPKYFVDNHMIEYPMAPKYEEQRNASI